MKLSLHGIQLLKGFESCKLIAYPDTRRVWTIGWGHTGPEVQKGVRWSQREADTTFVRDIAWAENAVNTLVKIPLAQNQFDALVCFVFNIGEPNFKLSTLLRKVNGYDMVGAQAQFPRWNKVTINHKLVVDPGLVNRRAAEKALFNLKDPTP